MRVRLRSNVAGIGLDATGEDLQQRGFAGAVGTDQANAVAFLDGEGDVAEERSGAEGFRNLVGVRRAPTTIVRQLKKGTE